MLTGLPVKKVMVIAHRGNSHFAPENTLASIFSAIAARVDMVEFDCHETKDNVPVLLHDDTLDRTTDSRKQLKARRTRLADVEYKEAVKLKAGSWFSKKYKEEKIPTVHEALSLVKEYRMKALVDHKAGSAENLLKVIESLEMQTNVIVQSSDIAFLKKMQKLNPAISLSWLGFKFLNKSMIQKAVELKVQYLNWYFRRVTVNAIRQLHEQNIKLLVFTVDEASHHKRMLKLGVDGIVTNRPWILKSQIKRM